MKPLTASVFVLLALGLGVFVGLAASRPALAEAPLAPRSAVCSENVRHSSNTPVEKANSELERWMNEQLAAGKTQFVYVPTYAGSMASLCAW
jgi:hypothetical protein